MNETMVTVTGNIAGDVISRRVGINEEHLLVTFRVASSERRWDKASESWVDGDRFTASVNCWRRLAEGAQSSLVKGDPVVVTGRLSVREYETEAGRRYMTEIAATAVGPDLSRCNAQVRRRRLPVAEGGEGATTVESVGGSEGVSSEGEAVPAQGDADDPLVAAAVTHAAGGAPTGSAPAVAVDEAVDEALVEATGATPGTASNGATVTGIGTGDRRRTGGSRASA